MIDPRLTLITICKGNSEGLDLTLESAAALRAAGAEHVVIDGGSAHDDSAGAKVECDGGVRLVRRSPEGIADAFNTGIASAGGEWVWFLNAGDRVDPRLAPGFLMTLLDTTRADVVIGGITYEGESAPRPHLPADSQWPPFRSWIPHPSTLVRRRLFLRFGPFDKRYTIAMDYEWWLRVLQRGAPVDVLAVPFTVFAPGGVSQLPESRSVIRWEKSHALRRHQAILWRSWLAATMHLTRACVGALIYRFARKPPRPR